MNRILITAALAAGLARIVLPANAHAGSVIATEDQIALDRASVEILAMPEVQAQKERLRQLYLQDAQAATPDGRARVEAALNSIVFASIIATVDSDPDRPKILWATTAPHDWGSLKVPGSGHGIDNPDNVYRNIPIDGAARYEITGRIWADGPLQQSFTLYRTRPGSGGAEKQAVFEGSPILGALTANDLKVGPDGAFTLTIDHDPTDGRPNHIQSGDNPDEVLIIRDTLSDWATQRPPQLSVRRVAGPPAKPERTKAEIADRAIRLMQSMVPFWLKFDNDYIYANPPNRIDVPHRRDGGWGFSVMARFDLAPDEALVVTLDRAGAKYLGVQIADPWSVAPDYISHSSSLNDHQAEASPDGAYTYVLSPRDPGVRNWIDTVGMRAGLITLRWQELADKSVSPDKAIRAVRVVKIADLKSAPPPGATAVSATERKALLDERARTYALRLSE